jgi:hypothetical protein
MVYMGGVLSEAIRKGEIGGGSGSKIRDQSRKVEVVEEELGAVLESGGRESQMLEKEWF